MVYAGHVMRDRRHALSTRKWIPIDTGDLIYINVTKLAVEAIKKMNI